MCSSDLCPVRASFLEGGFTVRSTGVSDNYAPNGGVTRMIETRTLGTELQRAGVTTALIGKYLNGYEDDPTWIPPGWDEFTAPVLLGDSLDTTFVTGSTGPDGEGVPSDLDTGGEHFTGWIFDRGVAFLDAHPDEPVFLLLTPQSPHILGTPAPEDQGVYAGYEWRPPSWDEADVSDKPGWIQGHTTTDSSRDYWDSENERMLENGLSLDRGLAALLDALEARGLDDRTVLLFVGDNGHLHGEHRLTAKGVAYEESVRVPLLVRAPGVAPREDARLVAWNLDLPATILDVFGVSGWGEGTSLLPALTDDSVPGRDHVFLEGSSGSIPVWAAVVTDRWKFVSWSGGDEELYDLDADPYELESLHAKPPGDADVSAFTAWIEADRALAIDRLGVPDGQVGVPYAVPLAPSGGTPPLTWELDDGTLPTGIALDGDGNLVGTPTETGSWAFSVAVTDSSVSAVTGGPQRYARSLAIDIGDAARAAVSREGDAIRFRVPLRPGEATRGCVGVDEARDTPGRCVPLREGEGSILVGSRRVFAWIERGGVALRGEWR